MWSHNMYLVLMIQLHLNSKFTITQFIPNFELPVTQLIWFHNSRLRNLYQFMYFSWLQSSYQFQSFWLRNLHQIHNSWLRNLYQTQNSWLRKLYQIRNFWFDFISKPRPNEIATNFSVNYQKLPDSPKRIDSISKPRPGEIEANFSVQVRYLWDTDRRHNVAGGTKMSDMVQVNKQC